MPESLAEIQLDNDLAEQRALRLLEAAKQKLAAKPTSRKAKYALRCAEEKLIDVRDFNRFRVDHYAKSHNQPTTPR